MQGDDSSNEDSFSVTADATTTPENTENDAFTAELQDLALRLEQLELEQRSLRIQLQRARLRHAGRNTTPSSPLTTAEPSAHPSPTPERSTSSENFNERRTNPYLRSHTTVPSRTTIARPPDHYTPQSTFAQRPEAPESRTPQAGDRLDATGRVLRVGDTVSFLATNYTTGGTGTVKRFTATFVIVRRNNGGEVRRAPSNVTRLQTSRDA